MVKSESEHVRRRRRLNRRCVAVLGALTFAVVIGVVHHASAESARALELEGRLIAPCCYVQTLDIHESEVASALRAEIRSRLARGEAVQAIEDDLVLRYGERIRAVPRGRDPRCSIPLIVNTSLGIAVALLFVVALRWKRRRVDADAESTGLADPELDAVLDAELRRDDDVR
jgi:cytochrome c-type biogenesis protein CcmH